MVEIKKVSCPADKIKIKCPYSMTPTRIVIHNTANDAPAVNEISYMHSNNKETSFHFAVDDKEIVQGIELNRNAWHAGDGGNGKGNREGIAIEICYSKSGGERWLKAVENAADLTAKLLKDYGWGIDKVTKHQDYSNKHCPHRILDEYGWNNFLNLVSVKLNPAKPAESVKPSNTVLYRVRKSWKDASSQIGAYSNLTNAIKACKDGYYVFDNNGKVVYPTASSKPTKPPVSTPVPAQKIDVIYQVWDDVNNKWLPNVKNTEDYAGIFGHDICAIFANLSKGNITYKVHYKGGKWLPAVINRKDYAGIFNKPIDGIMMKTDTGKTIHYMAHLRRKNKWLSWISGYNEKDSAKGYAGILGQEIDAIKIYID